MGVVLLYEDACEEVYALVWGCASRALFLVFLGVSRTCFRIPLQE